MYSCCRDADPSCFMKALPVLHTPLFLIFFLLNLPPQPPAPIPRVFPTGGWGESLLLAKNLLILPYGKIPRVDSLSPNVYLPLWHQSLISSHHITISCYNPINPIKPAFSTVVVLPLPIFILSSFSLYTQVMVILILIDVQYLQNVVFTLEKVQMVKFTLAQIPTTQ